MAYKTIAIRNLVQRALDKIPKPYSEDIIDEVAAWIEKNALAQYVDARGKLKKDVAENWIGQWTMRSVRRSSIKQVPSKLSTIIKTDSKLA